MTNLVTLPTEIVALIVDHLDERRDLYNCTKAHSQLHGAANPLLWSYVHLRHQAPGLRFLNCLVRAKRSVAQYIRYVHLEDFCWNDKALLILMKRAPHLVSLVLDNASKITDTSMQHIADYWPRLESLHLAASPITHDLSYRALGQLPKLVNLELWNCRGLQHDTFSVYFVQSKLERLMLAMWVADAHDMDPSVAAVAANEKGIDLKALGHLSRLKIHGAPFGMLHHQNGCDGGWWPQLTSVDFEACFMVDDDAIPLVRGLPPRLTHLAMKDGDFTNVTLDAIAAYQPNLVELDVSSNNQLTSRGIRRLVRHCPQLALVKLAYCDMAMEDFAEARSQCQGTVVTFDASFTGLDHLDRQAIDLIRRGPEHGDQDEEKEDQEQQWQ